MMSQAFKGIALSLVVNALTLLGWILVGVWPPAIVNALMAILILGIYGLDDKWGFPLGYWVVELLFIVAWIMGLGTMVGSLLSIGS